MKSGFLAALIVLLLPVSAFAQGWALERTNNGVLFAASAYLPDRSGFSLTCGGRVAGGPQYTPLIYEGWDITRPDVLRLALGEDRIGLSAGLDPRRDVLVVIGAVAFRLPDMQWDEMSGVWSTDLQATGAMFDAIAAAPSFEIHSAAGISRANGAGFGAAYAGLLNACRGFFAASGQPWASVPPVPAPRPAPPSSMRQAAEAEVARGCNGPSTYEPDAFLSGNIDGDGQPDVVLDWGSITCRTGPARKFCGASQCSADVFLSAGFPRTARPESLLGLGVWLQPLSNGNMAVAVGGSLSDCAYIDNPQCAFLFYWNGAELVLLP